MANRIITGANLVQGIIDEGGVGGSLDSPAKLAALEALTVITFAEHTAYQNAQVRAYASGKLTQAEAQLTYMALGETPSKANGGWSAKTTLAMKLTVMQTIGELTA